MRIGRIATMCLALGGLAAVLSGCLVFKSDPTAKQVGEKPKVAVKFTICESGGPECPDGGNADSDSGGDARVMLAFRVPKGAKPPRQFTAKSVTAAGSTSNAMIRNGSFKREMNAKAPKGQNFKWFGYVSEDFATSNGEREASFKVKIKVPEDLVGKKFKVAPTVGWTTQDASEDIDCGDSIFEAGGASFCVDDPAPDELKNIKVKVKEKD